MASNCSSSFVKPEATAVVIIGKVIKTETKTGTVPDLNQNKASKINAITGVVLIIAKGISIKKLKNFRLPHKQPITKPRIIEIIKAKRHRNKVKPIDCQKFKFEKRLHKAKKTDFGEGKIKGDFMIDSPIIQTRKMQRIDRLYAMT